MCTWRVEVLVKAIFIRPPDTKQVVAETPRYEKFAGYYPPLGMMSVATCVNQLTDHDAGVIDAAILGLSGKGLARAIKRESPDIIGLSAVSFTLPDALHTAHLVKSVDPDVPVVMGGVQSDLFPEQTVGYPEIDYVVRGDGEVGFLRLLDYLEGKMPLEKVPGVMGKQRGKVVRGKPPKPLLDFDSLPSVDRTLTPFERYTSIFSERRPCTIVTTARGCPYNCSFCYLPLRFGTATYRASSPERMVEEVASCAELGIKEIIFYDDTFTADRKRILEFCRLMKGSDYDVTWDVRTRPDCVDRELLLAMRGVGLRRVQMGVESGSQASLDSVRKGISIRQCVEAFALVKELGFDSFGYFMVGFPGETKEMMEETIRFALRLDPDYANFTVLVPLPGSELWDRLRAQGQQHIIKAWESFAENPMPQFDAPTCNGLLSKGELMKMLDGAYKAFYLRPRFVLKEIGRVRSPQGFLIKSSTALRIAGLVMREFMDRAMQR